MENITQGQWFRGPSADLGVTIEQSLRLKSSGYLKRAQSGSGSDLISSARTWTFSTWFKHGDMGETQIFGMHSTSSENWLLAWTNGASYDTFLGRDGSQSWVKYNTTRRYRDPNAWYHLFLTCSSGVLTCYVNGVRGNQQMTQNHSMDTSIVIGAEHTNGGSPMDGYLAETYFIHNTVLDAVDDGFIRLNEHGVYVPDTPTISDYGTQGFHLTYDSSQTNGIGHDSSGKNNHFTATNFETTAISSSNFDNDIDYEDTPTNNTATLNYLVRSHNTLSEVNLKWDQSSSNDQYFSVASIRMDQPTYGEMVALEDTNGVYPSWGVCNEIKATNVYQGTDVGGAGIATDTNSVHCLRDGGKYAKGVHSTSGNLGGPTWSAGDIVRWTFNPSNGECRTAVNGGSFFTWHTLTSSEVDDEGYKYFCAAACNTSGAVNFGNRPFVYSIPTGFKALQVNNLDEPTIKDGSDHFDAIVGPGPAGFLVYPQPNSPTPTATSAADFNTEEPIAVTSTYTSGINRMCVIFDTVTEITNTAVDILSQAGGYWGNTTLQGYVSSTGNEGEWTQVITNKSMHISQENTVTIPAQSTPYRFIKFLIPSSSNGSWKTSAGSAILANARAKFPAGLWWIKDRENATDHKLVDSVRGVTTMLTLPTLGADTTYTAPTGSSVAWCWNYDSSDPSTNGFEIITYTGTAVDGRTISHNLGAKPDFIITKERAANSNYWAFYHSAMGGGYGYMNSGLAYQPGTVMHKATSTTNWTTDANSNVNGNNVNYVSYVWKAVPGFSSFGKYEGNANADGSFIYLGFKPKLIMLKNADATNTWQFFDTSRDQENDDDEHSLVPESTAAEAGGYKVDFLSNGFKCRDTSGDTNGASTMIYCAWAEYPSGGVNVPPAPAH